MADVKDEPGSYEENILKFNTPLDEMPLPPRIDLWFFRRALTEGSYYRHYHVGCWGQGDRARFNIRDELKRRDGIWRIRRPLAYLDYDELVIIRDNQLIERSIEFIERTRDARAAIGKAIQSLPAGNENSEPEGIER